MWGTHEVLKCPLQCSDCRADTRHDQEVQEVLLRAVQ